VTIFEGRGQRAEGRRWREKGEVEEEGRGGSKGVMGFGFEAFVMF